MDPWGTPQLNSTACKMYFLFFQWSESWTNCTRTAWLIVGPWTNGCKPSCWTNRSSSTASTGSQQRSWSTATLCTWWAHVTPSTLTSDQNILCLSLPFNRVGSLTAFRSSLLRWMRCSIMVQQQFSATIKPFCWWRVCLESSTSKRTSRLWINVCWNINLQHRS